MRLGSNDKDQIVATVEFFAPRGFALKPYPCVGVFGFHFVAWPDKSPQVIDCPLTFWAGKTYGDKARLVFGLNHNNKTSVFCTLPRSSFKIRLELDFLASDSMNDLKDHKFCLLGQTNSTPSGFELRFLYATEKSYDSSMCKNVSPCPANEYCFEYAPETEVVLPVDQKTNRDLTSTAAAPSANAEAETSTQIGEQCIFSNKDIELVQSQTDSSHEEAVAALTKVNGDIVMAIMDLTTDKNDFKTGQNLSLQDATSPSAEKSNQMPKNTLEQTILVDQIPARNFLVRFILSIVESVMRYKHLCEIGLVSEENADAAKWDIFTRCIAKDIVLKHASDVRESIKILEDSTAKQCLLIWSRAYGVEASMIQFAIRFALCDDNHPVAKMFVSMVDKKCVTGAPSAEMADAFEQLVAIVKRMIA